MFFGSVDRLFVECAVSILPSFLHLAGLLFALGIFPFLFNINRIIFYAILSLCGIFTLFYMFSVFVSFLQPDSLLDPPLAKLPVLALACASCFFLTTFSDRFDYKIWSAFRWAFKDGGMYLEDFASKRGSEIDIKIFGELFDSLCEDDAVEKFFRAIPGFFNRKSVDIPPITLPAHMKDKFKQVLNKFLDHTFHSNTVIEDVRNSRLIICLDACHVALAPNDCSQILDNILDGKWPKLLQSVEMGHSLISWCNSRDEINRLYTRSIISRIIATVDERNDRWTKLVMDHLEISEDLLRVYLSHGDSVVLADFIHTARQITGMLPYPRIAPSHSKCNVSSALPGLQRDFCVLWNEIVQEAQSTGSNGRISVLILKNFRHVYIGLHEGTVASATAFSNSTTDARILDDPLSYPVCNISNHHSDPMPRSYDKTAGDISHACSTHSQIQPVAYNGVMLSPGTRPFSTIDDPSTLPDLGRNPLPASLSDVAAIGASEPGEPHIAVSVISSTPNPNPHHHTSRSGTTGEYEESVIHPCVVSHHALTPAISGHASPAVLSSSTSAVVTPSDYFPHASGFPSAAKTPTTTGPRNTMDLKTQIPTKESHQLVKSASSTHDISADILGPEDHQDGGMNMKLL